MAAPLTDAPPSVLAIVAEADLVHVRQLLRAESARAGLGLVDQTKLITAGSELARNILTYAAGARGSVRVDQVAGQRGRLGVRATFTDDGPGIEDLGKALTDGYSTSGGLGLGLPGSKRLVDEMTISSTSAGTTVVIVKWAR